jgi:hypothetical protein
MTTKTAQQTNTTKEKENKTWQEEKQLALKSLHLK